MESRTEEDRMEEMRSLLLVMQGSSTDCDLWKNDRNGHRIRSISKEASSFLKPWVDLASRKTVEESTN